jgi:ATP-dependent protease ClpP protease subunit
VTPAPGVVDMSTHPSQSGTGLGDVGRGVEDPEMAQRWQVKAHLDDNTCDPCRGNHGKTYRNRGAAYKDYPGGRGFKDCVGAKYGNRCRCSVVKRGKKGGTAEMTPEQIAALTERVRVQSETMSARAFTRPLPAGMVAPSEKLTMRAATAADDGSGATQVYLYDYIGGWDGVKAADVVLMLAGIEGPIDLHINSGGGSIFEGAAIYNAFLNYDRTRGAVTSYIDGVAASAASFIALAGREVVCEATATVMVHDGSGGAIGTADTLREVADLLDMLSNTIAAIYARKAGGTAAEWRAVMQDGDTWYDASAALSAKLVDRVANGDPPPDEDDDPAPDNALDLGVFNAWVERGLATIDSLPPKGTAAFAATDNDATAALDVAGIREALKGLPA